MLGLIMITPFPQPDLSLLKSWNWVMEHGEHPTEKPYIAVRTGLEKTFVYLAARHQGPASPTFKTVDALFEKFNPQAVVIEGVRENDMQGPNGYLDWVQEQATLGFPQGGEPAYTAWHASNRHIDVIPGELPRTKELEIIATQGYTVKDMIGYYATLSIHNNLRNGMTVSSEQIEKILNKNARSNSLNAPYTVEQFYEWYAEKMRAPYSPQHVLGLDISPNDQNDDQRLIQSIGRYIDREREPHIVGVIGSQLARPDVQTLAVVYGGDHHLVQGQMLDKWLSRPDIIKVAPTPLLI